MADTADSSTEQKLTFYLPGLFSLPGDSGAKPGVSYRTLETLLSRGEVIDRQIPRGYEEGLFALFNLARQDNADLPVAAVTRMFDMGVIDKDWWLRADPVHLSLNRDRLILADARKLEVTPQDANRLVAEVMEVFKADGWLLKAPHPERWYLKPLKPPKLTTTTLSRVVGRDVHGFLPQGPDDKAWHTIMNELQILLHTATVNAEREKNGKLPINSLWFWGSGRLPRITPVSWTRVWSNEPVTLSLAKLSGTARGALPSDYADWRRQSELTGEHLIILDEAHAASLYADATGWHENLQKIEQNWMEPLLSDLQSGKIARATLLMDAGIGYSITPRLARRWWRWRRSLASHGVSAD
ncbi:MAG: hypothetical protein OEM48_06615 [Gammaproteobacteria bacterium]|nr:hypothetical protein [Gammaproteobacteria bacterium]MDH3370308.1 hypothetical protein [Gammaproteobacteria bacterium]MDH3406591.1 hypothetical protein [Gammaproteobacteria bacterium]MDH3562413.1 hypothetical protein [Gammaproteobacteria bacterium]MDH5486942.1 hypothetical protein [Gammaproteobacteria bacterium]